MKTLGSPPPGIQVSGSRCAVRRRAGGRTTVPLHFEPWGTVFVMFREPTQVKSKMLPKPLETTLTTIDGSWDLSFQPDRGAPPAIKVGQTHFVER